MMELSQDTKAEQLNEILYPKVQAVHLVMYHLKVSSPETKYFKWREHICSTFDQYWDYLIPEKIRTATWHNTVAGCISTHNALFKSGFEETGQTGFWTLRTLAKPSPSGFKCKYIDFFPWLIHTLDH
ncbi:hypothetical protein BB560_005451 [Smittium megazygosporum]|uniref:Uncharacterized protein n=1 Tax=Smittium megazygosporum TaxID=133381 RepID=A0A2T9Z5E9_9FUNG|nr:hypothetical protein BB560_005451 [Smittium megazygosporum]